jgi:hypothetical protein
MKTSFNDWKKTLPSSPMVKPDNFLEKVKYVFWRVYTPYHPFIRDSLLSIGVLSHQGRQDFLIGYIAPGWTLESITDFLIEKGYGNHFIAWIDDGELVGLRYVSKFSNQYHIRIFRDGEIRGHYEYTPECHPILHIMEVGMQDCRNHFIELLGDCMNPVLNQIS